MILKNFTKNQKEKNLHEKAILQKPQEKKDQKKQHDLVICFDKTLKI